LSYLSVKDDAQLIKRLEGFAKTIPGKAFGNVITACAIAVIK
jgi:hypothetical protein